MRCGFLCADIGSLFILAFCRLMPGARNVSLDDPPQIQDPSSLIRPPMIEMWCAFSPKWPCCAFSNFIAASQRKTREALCCQSLLNLHQVKHRSGSLPLPPTFLSVAHHQICSLLLYAALRVFFPLPSACVTSLRQQTSPHARMLLLIH